jgi:hypothetical protein
MGREAKMKTDELIADLTADLKPVAAGAPVRRILFGMGLGGAASAALMLVWLGPRPDLAQAMATSMFWMKFAYTLASFILLLFGLERLARPGGTLKALAWASLIPFALVSSMALLRLMQAEPAMRQAMVMGQSSQVCPWRIVVLALPILAGAIWALRGLAPTRLPLAGLVAGACAGAMSAWIYSFHCDERTAAFTVVWYTGGVALVALLGALASRRLLRWT